METGFTDWTAFADVALKRKDHVFLAAKFTDKTSGKTELTVVHVLDGRLDHGSGLDHQLTLLHLPQVVHGEKVELLRQVNRKTLQLFIRPFRESTGFQQLLNEQQLVLELPEPVEFFHLVVQSFSDTGEVEQRLMPNRVQQLFGEITDRMPAEIPAGQDSTGDDGLHAAVAAVAEIPAQIFTVAQFLDVSGLHLRPTAGTQELLERHHVTTPVCGLNTGDDLEAWWSPAQGSSHPGPQSDLLSQAPAANHTFSTGQLLE